MLVDRQYEMLQNVSQGTATAADLQRVVEEFGEQLVVPPSEALEMIEVVELDHVDGRACVRARFALWTKDGPSELILEELLVNRVSSGMRAENLKLSLESEHPAG